MNLVFTSIVAGFMAIYVMVLYVLYATRQIQLGGNVFKDMTDGARDDKLNRRRIAFMSAAFNIPFSIILLGLIEAKGATHVQVLILATIFVISRILHTTGSYYRIIASLRSLALVLQFAYYTVCGVWLMSGVLYLIK